MGRRYEEREMKRGGEREQTIGETMLEAEMASCIASFPGPAQLSIACSTVKRERAWYLFSRE